jgi:hypothetical protein
MIRFFIGQGKTFFPRRSSGRTTRTPSVSTETNFLFTGEIAEESACGSAGKTEQAVERPFLAMGGALCYKFIHTGGSTMERVQFIQHKGRKILHLNFADCTSNEVLEVIEQAKSAIKTQSPQSVYTLTDVTNTAFDSVVSAAMKDFVLHNKPYIVASAVVGVTGLKQIIFNAVMKLSGRKLTAFENIAAAKDWLAGHA